MTMKDTDLMPFGEHKGKEMGMIPETYWGWMWDFFGKDFKYNKLKSKQKLQSVMEYVEHKQKSK